MTADPHLHTAVAMQLNSAELDKF